jgi:SnoaL-like domain
MTLTRQTMTDEQRKSVALEYLKAFDNSGVTSTGESILELFAPDAQVMFPKWGLANGREEIGKMFGDVGATLKSIRHDYANFTWVFSGSDLVVCEGTSYGEHQDGPWRAGVPEWGAGRWCDVFEIRDWQIHRCFIERRPSCVCEPAAALKRAVSAATMFSRCRPRRCGRQRGHRRGSGSGWCGRGSGSRCPRGRSGRWS